MREMNLAKRLSPGTQWLHLSGVTMFEPSAINAGIRFKSLASKQGCPVNWFARIVAIVRLIPQRRILNRRSEFVLGRVELVKASWRLIAGMWWRFEPATIDRR
jgi:hypothetical protein